MAGYNTIRQIRRLEDECDKLGFMMCYPKHSYSDRYGDEVAVKPKDQDSLPIYARDAEFFHGTLDELDNFILGVKWARDYDRMLFGKTHEPKRERKEQDWRNKKLIAMLKEEKNGDVQP